MLSNLAALRMSGALGRLALRHRRELAGALNAVLRRRLIAARPLPAMGRGSSQLLASTNGDSPRSARSMASSRFTGPPPLQKFFYSSFVISGGTVPFCKAQMMREGISLCCHMGHCTVTISAAAHADRAFRAMAV